MSGGAEAAGGARERGLWELKGGIARAQGRAFELAANSEGTRARRRGSRSAAGQTLVSEGGETSAHGDGARGIIRGSVEEGKLSLPKGNLF